MEGRVIGDGAKVWSGAALDSRKVSGGELFFALPGERTDGHAFVARALEAGAAAAVVQQDVDCAEAATLIRVGDSYEALHALTRVVRSRTPRSLIGITGSAGKTTTKELLAALLARRFRVARSPGNLNNTYGFPIALLGIDEDTEWMVAEMGMSTPGELGQVSRLGRPDIAVFTNVRPVHLEFFGTLGAITQAKAELLEGLDPDGLVVANADDAEVVKIAARHAEGGGRVVWYGVQRGAASDYSAVEIEPLDAPAVGSSFRFRAPDGEVAVELALYGRHNVENFLAAAACAHSLGVGLDQIASAAAEVEPTGQRGVVHQLVGGATILDETYNSNPDACRRVLEAARELPAARHWAVLGDMLELGADSERFHREVGEQAAELGFSPVVGVGSFSRALVEGARAAGADASWFEDAAAAEVVAELLRPDDLVVVKGSRGVALERVVRRMLAPEEAG